MSRSLNKVMLIGNVGNEPDIKPTSGGNKLAKVSLATNRSFTDRNNQQQDKTEWHRLTFWGKMADIVEQYVKKGDRLYVEGRLEYSQTEDAQGGGTRYWTDIVVTEMVMLGGGGGGGEGSGGGGGGYERSGGFGGGGGGGGGRQQRQSSPPPRGGGPSFENEDDDLPF